MRTFWTAVFVAAGFTPAFCATTGDYLPGGPLAGEELPLYATQHGEPPGHPGCLRDETGKFIHDPQAMAPEMLLYPGSVEHWRAYMFKYMPIRSFFDRQSLVKNFFAKDLPGVQTEPYAEPVYFVPRHAAELATGKFNAPVPIVRCKPGTPVIRLDLGELDAGLYAVRVIGAVETKNLEHFRKPLYLRAKINDGQNGEPNTYRLRLGYVDEFYSVAEIYFHATQKRRFEVELAVDQGSAVDLLIYNIDVHDVLAGADRRAIKQRMTLATPEERAQLRANNKEAVTPPLAKEARLARDEALWNSLPPINAQANIYMGGGDDGEGNKPRAGAAGKTPAEIEQEWGKWVDPHSDAAGAELMVNEKLKLQYTLDDLKAHRPLPDPYPFKDDGPGLYFPPEKPDAKPPNWQPIADAVRDRNWAYLNAIQRSAARFHATGDREAGRDAAVMLCRYAHDFPTMDTANALGSLVVQPGAYGRDGRCRRRFTEAFFLSWYMNYPLLIEQYDQIFDAVNGDEELAQSLHRFVPWIQTSRDAVKLFDVYLVQTLAKHLMRYHFHTFPDTIATCATALGDRKLTDPWMEWMFRRTWWYPMPLSGLQDLMVCATDRNGSQFVGSYFYAQGENAANYGAGTLEKYIRAGGNTQFDLLDPKRYPKPVASTHFVLRAAMAGLWHPLIGDVTGPEKTRGAWFDGDTWKDQMRRGWRWTHETAFAYMLKHYYGRATETDAEWAAIEAAAAKQKRAPWLENRSRVLDNWAGILESGVEHDDFRFRRTVMLRVGQGAGHGHSDSLDLQVFAHGLAMTCDGGQRPGYSKPVDSTTRVHNTVEVDGHNWLGHSWVSDLSDATGARYLAADTESHLRRQVALIDVDEGKPSTKPLTPANLRPTAKLDPDVVTPNSYVFDVVRVTGGAMHTYCFHGHVSDDFQVNMETRRSGAAEEYLKMFPRDEAKFAGVAPETVQATWRVARDHGQRHVGEKLMLGENFREDSPHKFTRLHVLGQKGARLLQADLYCQQWDYSFTNLYLQRQSAASVFPAIIEPYVGEPFIKSTRLVEISGNDEDAQRAVAVEVKTTNGHIDLCFADGKPERTRKVGNAQIAGEFAYCSTDSDGLRQASLTGGTLLQTPEATLRPALRERAGKVTKVDYAEKTVWLDADWKAPSPGGRVIEIGVPGHRTSYTIDHASHNSLTLQGGADFYLARIKEIEPDRGLVHCALGFAQGEGGTQPGLDKDWVASNQEGTKFWRAEYLGGSRDEGRYTFKLTGGPVAEADFGKSHGFRLWEYGAGDTVRQSTFVSLRRTAPGQFELQADTDVAVTLRGASMEISADGVKWKTLSTRRADNDVTAAISVGDLTSDGKVFVRSRP